MEGLFLAILINGSTRSNPSILFHTKDNQMLPSGSHTSNHPLLLPRRRQVFSNPLLLNLEVPASLSAFLDLSKRLLKQSTAIGSFYTDVFWCREYLGLT